MTYPANTVLTLTLTGNPTVILPGSSPGLQLPGTVTDSSGIADTTGLAWNIPGSPDVVLGSPD